MTTIRNTTGSASSTRWNIGLWAAQIALAGLYGMAAYMKLLMSPADLVQMGLIWVDGAQLWVVRAIGFAELCGVIGLILPAATRVMPKLTSYAAFGLLIIQLLAIPFHLFRGEVSALPFNFIYLALAVLVLWGRSRKAPIAPRA